MNEARKSNQSHQGTQRGDSLSPESLQEWGELLSSAPRLALEETEASLLVHGDHRAAPSQDQLEELRLQKRREVQSRCAKRYVLGLRASTGYRILKVFEPRSPGNHLAGLLGRSTSKTEHQNQLRCEALGLAACKTLGYIELRRGPLLLRAGQVQEPVDISRHPLLEDFFAQQWEKFSLGAVPPLARALAAMHNKGFIQYDLKPFPAYAQRGASPTNAPAAYKLLWIDLAGAGFRLTERQRVINLYQVLRYVLVHNDEAHEPFIRSYCEYAQWHAPTPENALHKVTRFLNYKLRTHPCP